MHIRKTQTSVEEDSIGKAGKVPAYMVWNLNIGSDLYKDENSKLRMNLVSTTYSMKITISEALILAQQDVIQHQVEPIFWILLPVLTFNTLKLLTNIQSPILLATLMVLALRKISYE